MYACNTQYHNVESFHVVTLTTHTYNNMKDLKATLDNVTQKSSFTVSFDAKAKKAKDSHPVKVTYDFDGVTIAEALEPAIKKLNIKVQAILKDSFASADDMRDRIKKEYKYTVEELLAPPTREYDPMKAGTKAVDKMTEEQQQAFLDEMMRRGLVPNLEAK